MFAPRAAQIIPPGHVWPAEQSSAHAVDMPMPTITSAQIGVAVPPGLATQLAASAHGVVEQKPSSTATTTQMFRPTHCATLVQCEYIPLLQ